MLDCVFIVQWAVLTHDDSVGGGGGGGGVVGPNG